jgi:hypothetical protein
MGHLVVRMLCGVSAFAALVLGCAPCFAQGLPIAMTKIGNPAFDLVDVNLFSANFMPTMPFEVSRIIMPHHALIVDQASGETGFGPRSMHAPPYDMVLDAGGNGWEFAAPFTVVPEPATSAPSIFLLLLFGQRRTRFHDSLKIWIQ